MRERPPILVFGLLALAGVLGSLASARGAQAAPDAPDAPGAPSAAAASPAADDPEAIPTPPPDTGVPGPRIAYASKPVLDGERKACSTRVPICVHAARVTPGASVLGVLASAERAWDTLTGALRLAPPDVDPDELTYPIYVVEGAPERGATLVAGRDVRSRIDRARAFTVLDRAASARPGCSLDALVAREVARAALYRVAPSTAEGVARAQTTYLAELVTPCATGFSVDAAQAFQSRPERAVCDARVSDDGSSPEDGQPPRPGLFAEGAALFWSRIDWAYGRTPGAIVTASWALSPTMTDVGSARWHDEPDAFDVLRVSFKNALSTHSTLDDLLLDTAVARAFMGSNDDGLHQVETATLGEAARVPFDWDVPWPAKPRRIAPRTPVFPTGASYVVVHRAGAPRGSRLRVELAWEEHALFRWAFVKLDARGHELGRVVIPTPDRATEVQMTLVDLDDVDRILLVGVNAGDPSYRFDPDDEVWEPHAWLLTLASE